MNKVNIGVLGYGFVQSTFHLPCYKEIEDAQVLAIGGRKRGVAEEVAKKFGVEKVFYGEDFIERLCSDPEIDVVDIGLPNFLHKKATELAAENGKHVICEKPLARNKSEAKAMLDTVERHGIIGCYAENQVFIPQISRAVEIIENGGIGNVFWVRSREAHSGPHSMWFWDPDLAGGGVLVDMGCHSVEVARRIIRRKPLEASAWGATLVHDIRSEDNSIALIRYEDNVLGQSENSWAAHGGLDVRFEIYGSDGAIFIDVTRETGIRVFTLAAEEKVGYVVEKAEVKRGWMYPIWREHELYGYLSELEHFISCLKRGVQPLGTFKDGYLVNCLLEACYRSFRTRKWEPITT